MRKVKLVIPCLNEESIIESTVERTVGFVRSNFPGDAWTIVLSDNGSTDRTPEICRSLEDRHPNLVTFRQIRAVGKGIAVRTGWAGIPADVYAFFDADLATDLSALPNLIDTCHRNGGGAIGSRYHPESKVDKTVIRRIFSVGYRLVLQLVLGTKIHDLPCGFKAFSSNVIKNTLPEVKNNAWFFDSELTVRAERAGYRIDEIPVRWRDLGEAGGRPTRVSLWKVSREYLRCSWQLRRELKRH